MNCRPLLFQIPKCLLNSLWVINHVQRLVEGSTSLNSQIWLWKCARPDFCGFQRNECIRKCPNSMTPNEDLQKNCQNEVSMSNCKQTILKLINDNKIHSRYFKVIKTDFLRILSSEQGQKCGFLILKLRTFGVTVNTIFVVFVLKHTFQQLLAATLDNFLPFDFRFGLTRRHFLPIIRDFWFSKILTAWS